MCQESEKFYVYHTWSSEITNTKDIHKSTLQSQVQRLYLKQCVNSNKDLCQGSEKFDVYQTLSPKITQTWKTYTIQPYWAAKVQRLYLNHYVNSYKDLCQESEKFDVYQPWSSEITNMEDIHKSTLQSSQGTEIIPEALC